MNITYDDAVGAGHGRAAAGRSSADADDADRAAGNPDDPGDTADVDAEQTKEGGTEGRARLRSPNNISVSQGE